MDGKSSIIRIFKAFSLSAATTAVLFVIFAAVCGISFAVSALALTLSIVMYIRYYKDNY